MGFFVAWDVLALEKWGSLRQKGLEPAPPHPLYIPQQFRTFVMPMKKLILLVSALLLAAITANAQFFEGFSVESYKITRVWPTSFRSVRGDVKTVVSNTGDERTLSGLTATVYRNGVPFAYGRGDDETVWVGRHQYLLKGYAKLAENVTTWQAIKAALAFKADEYTLDFNLTITHANGKVDYVVRKGVPLSNYLKRRR